MKLTKKNKVGNTMWAKLCSLIGQKRNTVVSKLTWKISLSVSGK